MAEYLQRNIISYIKYYILNLIILNFIKGRYLNASICFILKNDY
nr:MAG TPA: hypothetical protein [Caudoviricetes sp.]